jgi:hypothetical protein
MEEGEQGGSSARSDEPQARSEVRWSARRKEGAVLRVLRGESLDLVAEVPNTFGTPFARRSKDKSAATALIA